MKPLNLKGVKKVSSDADTSTFEHPSGHKIVVVHKLLSPEHKKMLDALPAKEQQKPKGYDDGGEVLQDPPLSPYVQADPTTANPAPASDTAQALAPDPQAAQPAPAAAAAAAPQGAVNPYVAAQNQGPQTALAGIGEQKEASEIGAETAGQEGQQQANAAQQSNTALMKTAGEYQKQQTALMGEVHAAAQDIGNSQIKPNDYLDHMSTGSKIATALGMIVSGFGAGVTGKPNMAAQFLDDQIKRNIDAQIQNVQNKKGMISALIEQGHSLNEAAQMSSAIQKQYLANKITQIAGNFAGENAANNAAMFAGKLTQESAQTVQQLALNKAIQSGNLNEIPDALDPNEASSFRLGGQKLYAPDPATAQKAREQAEAIESLEGTAKQINDFNKQNGTTGAGIGLPTHLQGQADSLNNTSKAAIARLEAAGGSIARLASTFEGSMPKAGALLQAQQTGKAAGINNVLNTAKKTLRDTYAIKGIPVNKMSK